MEMDKIKPYMDIFKKVINKIFYFLLIFLLSILFLGLNPVSGASNKSFSNPQQLLAKADQSKNALLASPDKVKYRDNWFNCISKYQEIYEKYPQSDQAPWALYHSAVLSRKLYKYSGMDADLNKALSLFEKLANEYINHRLADDAQYYRGEIYYREKNNPAQACVEFQQLDQKFPSGDMKTKAKEILDKLSAVYGKKAEIKIEKSTAPTNGLASIKNIRYWSTPTYTRVVIDADAPVKYKYNLLKEDIAINKPRRLYIDFENSRVSSDIVTDIAIKDGLLQGARAGQFSKNTVRVVLDIENIGEYKIFPLYDPFRIIIDVQGDKEKATKKQAGTNSTTRTKRKGIFKPDGPDESVTLARQLGLTVRRIVIDPGHGGEATGCYLGEGIQEKDIVLDLAKRLAAKIEKEIGCEVLLTRDKDVFLPLDERTAFANVNKADLFISLHVNAHKESSVYGIETYFLNMATDESAVMVAARENATSRKNISDLQSILHDLMLNTKISESSKFAYKVQNAIMRNVEKNYMDNKSLGVKQAPFYVLIGAEMPAVLVEIGFITNPGEKERILSDSYKDILADGIVTGIDIYKKSIEQAYDYDGDRDIAFN
jgi:N-acetylmuramoyl-L-alanine amidase